MTEVRGSRVPVFSLGERIRKAREDQALSQQGLADLLGLDRKTVSGWESDKHMPRLRDLLALSAVTDVSAEWLSGGLYAFGNRRPAAHSTVSAGATGNLIDAGTRSSTDRASDYGSEG